MTNQPIKYLIYSHYHYDHIAGGKAFKDAGARIIAHRKVREHLAPLGDPNTVLPDESFDRQEDYHPRWHTKKDAQEVLTLYQEASAEIKKLGQDGKCWDTVEKEFKMPKYATLPGYEAGLGMLARRYCGFWGRGT